MQRIGPTAGSVGGPPELVPAVSRGWAAERLHELIPIRENEAVSEPPVGEHAPIRVRTRFSGLHDDPQRTGLLPSHHADGRVVSAPRQRLAPPYRADGLALDLPAIPVSNDPETRLLQISSMYRRNPGFVPTGPGADRAGAAARRIPVLGRLIDYTRPTALGVGQVTYDQTRWMIDRGALVDDPWWIKGNTRIIGDALTAEWLVRSGQSHRSPNHAVQGWIEYIKASDAVLKAAGKEAPHRFTQPGAIERVASGSAESLERAWTHTPLATRRLLRRELIPNARLAFWKAHEASALMHMRATAPELAQLAASHPDEGAFARGWMRFIGAYRVVNLPAAGHNSLVFQHLLPKAFPIVAKETSGLERLFVAAMSVAGKHAL